MERDFGIWVVVGFMAWIVVGFSALTILWKMKSLLGRYFSAMETTSWQHRAALGWRRGNPIVPILGVRQEYSHRRLFWRLTLWGPPPQLKHSQEALSALQSYRRLALSVYLMQALVVVLFGYFFTWVFLWMALGVSVAGAMLLRPDPWTENVT
ncbi:hypothetical protein [Tritonibacter mobilis]|uniref:hypothetical protein n=1 Tax=Tritonibacter mobilis TaxID=379347 RepID=UPI001C08723A|nr:hypothetical protein [Tritonibacter mobilis]MBU3034579.1 hypothetical protein [Tritonibacter mobilis]WHQ84681.1 hypothetical protein OMR53_15640 [Tritonibacter mobilis]